MLFSPADLEGHKGKTTPQPMQRLTPIIVGRDKRFYLLDFSRVQPPEKPNPLFKNSHLVQLLRPEFLQEYHKALCPDAFSGFIRGKHNQFLSNSSVLFPNSDFFYSDDSLQELHKKHN